MLVRFLSFFPSHLVPRFYLFYLFNVLVSGAENPTYLKEPTDKVFVAVAFTGLFIGVSCIVKGLYDMSYGINKLK